MHKLVRLADTLDSLGLTKEADLIDQIIVQLAADLEKTKAINFISSKTGFDFDEAARSKGQEKALNELRIKIKDLILKPDSVGEENLGKLLKQKLKILEDSLKQKTFQGRPLK